VRYLFRGLIRDTGGPVEGHVEAAAEEDAYEALSENGVVTESLIPDPKPLNLNEELPTSPEFADALESAFDSSSSQVDFDALSERYQGKKVWVIDRDKIRRRVAQVVDAALALAQQHGEASGKARERVQNAIQGLFNDTRNLATQRNADSIAGVRFNAESPTTGGRFNGAPPPPQPPRGFAAPPTGGAGVALSPGGHPGLEQQIARLAGLVKQAEATLTAVAAAARRGGGGGGGGPRRRAITAPGRGEEQNSVLLEIFKSNLELVRGMQDASIAGIPLGETTAPGAAPQPEPAPAPESPVAEAPGEASSEIGLMPQEPSEGSSEAAGHHAEEPLPDAESLPGAEEIPEQSGRP
jgi:hypothetical protein